MSLSLLASEKMSLKSANINLDAETEEVKNNEGKGVTLES